MDFLNKALAQLSDLFRSMTPGGRLTAGLLLVVTVVSLGYLFQHQISGGDDYLFNGQPVPAESVGAMEEAFGKAHLNSHTFDGLRIRVPRADRAAYMAALGEAKALPANFGSLLERGDKEGSPFDSPDQRKARAHTIMQAQVSQWIREMPGIEKASVIVDMGAKGGLGRERTGTATVAVKPTGSAKLDEDLVESIQLCVCGAFEGLKSENVTVTDLNAKRSYRGPPGSGGAGGSPYAKEVRRHEDELRTKVLGQLSYIPGAIVAATVQLNTEQASHVVKIENGAKTVPLNEREDSVTENDDSGGGTQGRPGTAPNANTPTSLSAGSVGGAKGSHKESEKTKTEKFSVPMTQERTDKEMAGLTPKLAKVAVNIPVSYFEKVWRDRNPVKAGEEPKKPDQTALEQISTETITSVKQQVTGMLPPLGEGANVPDPSTLVTVTTFQDIKLADLPSPGTSEKAISWFGENWRTLGMVGLVLVSLVMLRSMVRSAPALDPETSTMSLRVAATEPEPQAGGESPETVAARRLRRITGSGPSLRDELSEMVKEDPDAAANILRSWIGQVG